MGGGSFERGGHPRSVPDQDGDAYEDAMQRQRAFNARQEAESAEKRAEATRRDKLMGDRLFPLVESREKVAHPGVLESLVPIWGSTREAAADLEDHNYLGAAGNAVLAATDVAVVKSLIGGLLKGGLKTAGPFAWHSKPWEEAGARKWLGEHGFLAKGQPGHHWLFENRSSAPDWLKNQPPFIKGTADAVEHGRIHGPYTVDGVRLPQFNAAQRFWYGTPDWWKALHVSVPGHAGAAVGRSVADRPRNARH